LTTTVEHLQALGMTEWEARAYLALLEESPSSGYGVAKRSGVPRAKVYEVLASLEAKGAVHVASGEPKLYGPVQPGELIERWRDELGRRIDAAEEALANHAVQVGGDAAIWDIQGRGQIFDRARQLVRDSTQRLMLEIWAPDADELRADLAEAAARGVRITVVAYGDPRLPFADVYPHPSTDEVTAGLGGRWLVLSVDNREVVAGIVSSGVDSRAAWTSHPALVVPITELVKHDLYKLEMLAVHKDVLEAEFGPGLIKLRTKFGAPGPELL
jgi:HTH-type transcriptional regulator, sugar sensing transcriptional regulator